MPGHGQYEEVVAALEARGLVATRNGSQLEARCPAHDDRHPSLSVARGDDGRALVTCHASCSFEEVMDTLGLRNGSSTWRQSTAEQPRVSPVSTLGGGNQETLSTFEVVSPVPDEAPQPPEPGPDCTRSVYTDMSGQVMYYVDRWDSSDGKKKVRPLALVRTDQGLQWKRKVHPAPRPLYNLEELGERAETGGVLMVEGEKTADEAKRLFASYVATTWSGGSSAVGKADFRPLTDATVTLWPDNDVAGRKAMEEAAVKLSELGASVSTVSVPDTFPDKWDVADPPPEGWSPDTLQGLIEEARPYKGSSRSDRCVITLTELRDMKLEPRRNIVGPWLPEQGLAMIYGPRGVGKTYVGLTVGLSIAYGGLGITPERWEVTRPGGVLYLDGEMPLSLLQARLETLAAGRSEPPAPFRIYSPELNLDQPPPNLGTEEGQRFVEQYLDGIKVIIVDHISALCSVGRENEAESWLPVQSWALRMRSRGLAVVFIHHAGKGGAQRGTSRREDVLDTVIGLKMPEEGSPEDGAAFEVHYEKSRMFYGKDAQPFLMTLDTTQGAASWRTEPVEGPLELVARLHTDGLKQREIVEETGMSKGYVSKLVKRAKQEGLVT